MKRWIKPTLFTLLVFFISLIATTPARWLQTFIPPNSPVKLQSVTGTIWKGEAMQASWQKNPLGKLNWSLRPFSLLTGKLGVNFNLENEGIQVNGDALINRDQQVKLTDTKADIDVNKLPLDAAKMLVSVEGRINADIRKLIINNQSIDSADATLVWKPASITAPIAMPLGEITLEISGEDGNLTGKLNSKNSPVNATGNIAVAKNGTLTSNIRLKPNSKTPQDIRELLPVLGKQERDGSVKLHYQGRIKL